jgi:hypothetical protein
VYLAPGSSQLMEKIRVKGIPHASGPFKYLEEIELEYSDEAQDMVVRMMKWVEDPEHCEVPSDFIKERMYLFRPKDEEGEVIKDEVYFARHINFQHIRMMMAGEGEMTCFFGTMDKSLRNSHGVLRVTPTVISRIPCSRQWWPKSQRHAEDKFALSYPDGYEEDRAQMNYMEPFNFLHVSHVIKG